MRLIDADKLKIKIRALHFRNVIDQIGIYEKIDTQPTIDPESLRPRAHWIHKQAKLPGGVLPIEECSLCGCQAWQKTNFCPHCGAKMEDTDES